MQTPSPLPKVAVASCSKHLPLAALGGGREVLCEGRQEVPTLAFLRGRRERGGGVQRIRAGSGSAEQKRGNMMLLPQGM